jgi:type VI secretion system secreted protein VgrG
MTHTQENRPIAIDTPLGEDVLLLRGFTGYEGISRLFSFHLDLLAETSAISFNKIVGQRVTIRISPVDDDKPKRYINGFISRFVQSGSDRWFTHYHAEVVPWLWFLTRTADCRIFQNMTVPDIITKIFKDLGFTDFKNRLEGTFEPRDYCVQYRETDFNFVSRLMEQYGIFYFFEHEEEKHTLVIANAPTVHQPCPGQAKVGCDFASGVTLT